MITSDLPPHFRVRPRPRQGQRILRHASPWRASREPVATGPLAFLMVDSVHEQSGCALLRDTRAPWSMVYQRLHLWRRGPETHLFFGRTRLSASVTAMRRFFSSWLFAASAARASCCCTFSLDINFQTHHGDNVPRSRTRQRQNPWICPCRPKSCGHPSLYRTGHLC